MNTERKAGAVAQLTSQVNRSNSSFFPVRPKINRKTWFYFFRLIHFLPFPFFLHEKSTCFRKIRLQVAFFVHFSFFAYVFSFLCQPDFALNPSQVDPIFNIFNSALFFCLLLTKLVKTCKFRYEVDSSPRLCR